MADEIEHAFVTGGFPWFYQPNVNNRIRPKDRHAHTTVIVDETRYQESFGFAHLLFPADTPSPWMGHAKHIFEAFLNRHRMMPNRLIRVKANLLVRTADPRPFAPHVDLPTPHWVVIYYVNDSDGDTVILDKQYPDRDGAAVLHTVSPKKGRAILFDGRHYHCGTCPTRHDARVVLNYDFV